MIVKKYSIALTGSADGTGTFYSDNIQYGKILSVTYLKDSTVPLTSGAVDIVVTAENTEQAILTISNASATATYCPRHATCDEAAAASLYAAGGEPVEDYIFLANERIKVVLADAGTADKKGELVVLVG